MKHTYFIGIAITKDNKQYNYISNTDPIIWDECVNNAKRFLNLDTIKSELNLIENFNALRDTILYTDYRRIVIGEITIDYNNNIQLIRIEDYL